MVVLKKPNSKFLILQNGDELLDVLAELKLGIVDRYERWRQDHPDGGVDMDTTPNVRTQQLANENAARERAQQELRIRDEEAAVPGHGSQSTVVPMDGTGVHYYWSGRKCRVAETCSTLTGGTRISLAMTNDSESLNQDFRRLGMDYESEETPRVTRLGLTSPNLPYPPNSPSANAQETFSLFPTHLGASSSTAPKSMFYPTAVVYPKLGPTAMPLESPHYEGDSTDSDSLNQDFRRLGMDSNNQRSQLKPVRKYVPIYH